MEETRFPLSASRYQAIQDPSSSGGRRRRRGIQGRRDAVLGADRIWPPNSAPATASRALPSPLTSAPSAPRRGGPRSSPRTAPTLQRPRRALRPRNRASGPRLHTGCRGGHAWAASPPPQAGSRRTGEGRRRREGGRKGGARSPASPDAPLGAALSEGAERGAGPGTPSGGPSGRGGSAEEPGRSRRARSGGGAGVGRARQRGAPRGPAEGRGVWPAWLQLRAPRLHPPPNLLGAAAYPPLACAFLQGSPRVPFEASLEQLRPLFSSTA